MQTFLRYWKWLLAIAVLFFLLYFGASIYGMVKLGPQSSSFQFYFLLIGLLLGAFSVYLLFKLRSVSKSNTIVTESSHTIVESMRKVFKVVCAEGYFSELYDYKESKKLFSIIPAYKSALVIIKAKVLIGFDFEKMVWELDEEQKQVRILEMPEPQIISIEPDYNYYSITEEIFYKFSTEDFNRIHVNGKKQIEAAALQSDLRNIAQKQLQMMLPEIIKGGHWQLIDKTQKFKLLPT